MNVKPVIDFAGLGALVKGYRESKRLTLRAAAEQAGLSAATLSRIERGDARPDLDTVQRLVDWIGVPLERVALRAVPAKRRKEGAGTLDSVELQFRADPELPPEAAEALIKIVRAAYEQMTQAKRTK